MLWPRPKPSRNGESVLNPYLRVHHLYRFPFILPFHKITFLTITPLIPHALIPVKSPGAQVRFLQ